MSENPPQAAPPAPSEKLPRHGRRCKFVFPPEKDGPAIYEYPNNYFLYTGDWKKGVKDGKGVFQIGPNSYYSGDFVNGEISGNGTRVFANGNVYEGEFQNGEFNGRGKFIDKATGEEYEGDWRENRRHGEGVLKLRDGTVYRGHFERHKRNGRGEYTSPDGNNYIGEWVDNRITGKGVMTYANGDIYEGDFVDGQRHGRGTIRWNSTGFSYAGDWASDQSLYHPVGLEISELPPFTPGSPLSNIVISVVGGAGESGRRLRISVEIGRVDPNSQAKKAAKPKKNEPTEHEPKFFVLNTETGDTVMELTVENGSAIVPPIPIPIDTEQNTFTLLVTDLTPEPLPDISADFQWVPAGSNLALGAGAAKARASRRGATNSRSSDRKSVKGK
jgi:hypothetical protein